MFSRMDRANDKKHSLIFTLTQLWPSQNFLVLFTSVIPDRQIFWSYRFVPVTPWICIWAHILLSTLRVMGHGPHSLWTDTCPLILLWFERILPTSAIRQLGNFQPWLVPLPFLSCREHETLCSLRGVSQPKGHPATWLMQLLLWNLGRCIYLEPATTIL